MYIVELVIDKKIIMARAVEWDLFSSTFKILFNMGTSNVPPPEPKTPLINPVKAPITQFLKLKGGRLCLDLE